MRSVVMGREVARTLLFVGIIACREGPTAPVDPGPWEELDTGGKRVCARNARGEAYCWGQNVDGGLGDGTRG